MHSFHLLQGFRGNQKIRKRKIFCQNVSSITLNISRIDGDNTTARQYNSERGDKPHCVSLGLSFEKLCLSWVELKAVAASANTKTSKKLFQPKLLGIL